MQPFAAGRRRPPPEGTSVADREQEPDYTSTIANPASPEGLKQVAAQGYIASQETGPDGQKLQPWYGNSYINAAQNWYGGRNVEGENNGWSTDFMSKAMDYYKDVERRTSTTLDTLPNPTISYNMFDTTLPGNERATGVATWSDPRGRWKVGDVFEDGKKRSNLYDSMDEATADLMLADFMFTGKEKADIFADSDIPSRLRREVSDKSAQMSQGAIDAESAYGFNAATQKRAEDIAANPLADPTTVLGGAAGGAALGAPIGAALTSWLGPGALVGGFVGGGIGGVIGGVGAWLNQDQIVEQVARSAEITNRALDKYDPLRASLLSMKEWSGVGMRTISPFSNVWQGSYDALSEGGVVGDGRSEFYAVDRNGERKASGLIVAGDIAATVLDSVTQFAGAPGRIAYMGTMAAGATGGLGGALLTQGTFNMRTGQFDPFETPGEWIGGLGSPLIDVAQIGMAGAVTRAATRFAREGQALGDAAAATVEIERGGMRFVIDKATGRVVDHRTWTLGALAPSENIWQVPIRWRARTQALKAGNTVVNGDDLYRAATQITAPASPWRGALVNGLAEGYEEAWQGILDPMSTGDQINGSEVFVQALYGAAGGIGMSAGALMQRTKQGPAFLASATKQDIENQARFIHSWRNDTVYSDDEWNSIKANLSLDDLRRMAAMDPQEAQEIGGVVRTLTDGLTFDNTHASVLGDAFARAVTELLSSGLRNVNPNAEEALTILGFENNTLVSTSGQEYVARSNAAMMSAGQVERLLRKRVQAMKVQLDAATTPEMKAEITARLRVATELHERFAQMIPALRTPSIDQAKAVIAGMNELLTDAYDGQMKDAAGDLLPPEEQAYWSKVATLVLGRHPFLDSGSFAGFLPQVSFTMTLDNAVAAVGIHQGFLKPMQADHDGDRSTTLNLAFLPDETIDQLRKGLQQYAPVNGEDGAMLTHGIDMPDGENIRTIVWAEELRKSSATDEHKAVASAVRDVQLWLLRRFADHSPERARAGGGYLLQPGPVNPSGPLSWDEVMDLATEFADALAAGSPKAMPALRDALLNKLGPAVLGEMSTREPVLLELQQYFATRFRDAGAELARLRLTSSTPTPILDQARPADVVNQRGLSRSRAATVSQTLGNFGNNDPTRDAQMMWYSPFTRVLADVRDNGWTNRTVQEMARLFLLQTTGDTRTEEEKFLDKNPVQTRVLDWLDEIVRDISASQVPEFAGVPMHELRIILSMMQVPSVKVLDGEAVPDADNSLSLMQYLLRRSIEVETDILRNVPDTDPRWKALSALRSLTYDNKPHSYTPKTAAIEMLRFLPVSQVVGAGDTGYLGSNTTLDQRITELSGLHPTLRKEAIHRLKTSPAYMREQHQGLGDPPYAFQDIFDDEGVLRVNAYTLTVDALETAVNKLPTQHAMREEKTSKAFRSGLADLQNFMEAQRAMLLQQPGGARDYSPEELLTTIIEQRPELADMIVALIPEAALSGTFMVQDTKVYAAKWLMDMLTTTDLKLAEKKYFVFRHLASFNMRGAAVDRDSIDDSLTGEARKAAIQAAAGEVKFDELTSRFEQTLFIAAEDPTGMLLSYMLQQMDEATSLEDLLTRINAVPALLSGRAELLGYLDDVALFEASPQDLWAMGLTSTQMYEALTRWSTRIKQMSDAAISAWTMDAADTVAVHDMLEYLRTGEAVGDAVKNVKLLQLARANRVMRPDSIGPTARTEFLRIAWDPFVHMEDKGAAPEVARFVESILTSFSWGVQQGWEQAIDGVTQLQWQDVATNVTKLLEGPVRIMMPDGASMYLDMTDDLTVVKMLNDPSMRAFAKAVLFGTVRDVDQQNALQHYADTATDGSIVNLLAEQDNVSMLDMRENNPRNLILKAHRGIGQVESALIKKAMTGEVAEQGAATLPITRALGEILVAYTSRADLHGVNRDQVTNDAVREMWTLLVAMASQSDYERSLIRLDVENKLRARIGGAARIADFSQLLKSSPLLKASFDQMLTDLSDRLMDKSVAAVERARGYEAERDALPEKNQRTPKQESDWQALDRLAEGEYSESERLLDQAEAVLSQDLSLVEDSILDVETVKQMYFLLDENEPGLDQAELERRQRVNIETRLNIRNLLELGNNKEVFRGKGTELGLLEKLAEVRSDNLDKLNDPKAFTAEDWKQLSLWAATIHFTNESERSADQALRSLGKPEVDRLYDRTYSYLTDILFDPAVLAEVKALFPPSVLEVSEFSMDSIANMITGKLLSEDRLGPWNSSLVTESLKIKEMLTRGPVGLAVPAAGSHAVLQRAQVGTSTATTTLPLAEHLTTVTLDPNNVDPSIWRLIQNGFFSDLTITNQTTAQTRDIAGMVGAPSARPGMDPAYLILRKASWDQAMRALQAQGFYSEGQVLEVAITFVDPDKKPFTEEYVNSVYFDKAGRTEEGMYLGDVISESIFSTDGWSKISQQRVFDVAARGGSAGFPTPSIPLSEVGKLPRDPAQAGEFIRRAAQLILEKQYNDMEPMLDTDQAAVIKLLKQRFVVVGDKDGVRHAHWIDEVIAKGVDELFDPGTAEIVGLSVEVASTLLAENAMELTPGTVTVPAVNPSELGIPGSLDAERLRKLGITELGETISWDDANSPLRSFNPLRAASMSENRGDAYMRTYRQRLERWQAQASRVKTTAFPQDTLEAWAKQDTERIQELSRALSGELMLTMFARMGLTRAAFNTDSMASDLLVRSQLLKFFGPEMSGRRVFRYLTTSGNRNLGELSKVEIANDFEEAGNRPPVYGDFVMIDLDQFVTGPLDDAGYDNAARQVQEVMEAFGRRGVRIFLTSTSTSYQIKERIATWMQSDPMGYEPVHNSTSVYVPVIEFGAEGRTARALRQSLTEVEVFNPWGVTGRILSDMIFPLLGANENTVLVDTTYDGPGWRRIAQVLVPGDLVMSGYRGAVSLNYPTDDQMPMLQRLLLPAIEDQTTWTTLLEGTNPKGDVAQADPKDIALYNREQFANGIEITDFGVLSVEDARQRLIDLLKTGNMPGINSEIIPGDFLPVVNVDRDGSTSVVLSRVGFKLPDEESIRAQWSKVLDPNSTVKIAISTNKIENNQTVPPPMRITKKPIYTSHGLLLIGEFDHHKWAKWIDAGTGFKAGRIKLSALEFLGAMAANGFRPSEAGSLTSESGKRTTNRTVTNFQDLFTVTGFDIKNLLVDALIGEQVDEKAYADRWSELERILDAWSRMPHGLSEDDVYKLMTLDGLATSWSDFASHASALGLQVPSNPAREALLDDPTTRIAALTVMSLMAPRIRVKHLVSTPGLMTVADRDSETLQIVTLPALFTKAMQNPDTPKTIDWLVGLANRDMPKGPDGRPIYWFDTNFKFHTRMISTMSGAPEEIDVEGWFQIVKPTPATEDLNAYADANTKARKDESLHIAGVTNSAIGALTTLQRDFEDKATLAIDGEKIVRFGDVTGRGLKGNLWGMLTRIKKREDAPFQLLPLQQKYLVDSIEDVRGYSMAYDKSDWADKIDEVRKWQALLLRELGLTDRMENQRIEVDYLVRQFYGSPGAREGQKNFVEPVTATDYIEAVRLMLAFVKDGRNPLEAAKVPIPHETLWRKIYEAGKWSPRLGRGKPTRYADGWEEFVYALFGQVQQSEQTVDTRFRRPMDGFMRSYIDTIPALASVPVSGDDKLNARLLDPEVNAHFISMDPGVSALLSNPVILSEMEKTISNMMGLTQDVAPFELASMDSSALIAHRARVERWAHTREMEPQVRTSYLEYLEVGTEYVGRAGRTHALMSGLVNLSLMNRLFNPALYVSAIFEVVARTSLETFTDLLLGTQIRGGGVLANRVADISNAITSRTNEDGKTTGLTWHPRYSAREIQLLRSLARELASSSDFMEFLYKDLLYTNLVEKGRGKISTLLEKGATKTARAFSDPRWGMFGSTQTVTQLYLASALEYMTQTGAVYDVEAFVQQMKQDPLFLVKNSREEGGFSAHRAGMNRVAQIRSLKATTLGKAFTSPINAMTQGKLAYNFLGHLLKIPFQFASFTSNAIITITGLGGIDQILAMYLDGKDKPGFMNRMSAHVRGEKPLKDEFDMSDVLEAVDLSRAFIRGGVTQTGLFAAAMFASNLGLGGEDDEMRKRRKLAEYLHTPLYLDPREMQNDFRYADAIFLDNIPILNTIFADPDMPEGEQRSVVIPHWTIRQFTSPMMGTMRFLQTGDPADIAGGFMDAFSVLPYSVLNLWKEANLTADALFGQAAQDDYEGNSAEAQSRVTNLIVSAVSVYEKALLENSFINGVRNTADEYNRNPWIVSATDPTGNILMREGTNNMPLPSKALTSYTDPQTGEVKQAYDKRYGWDGIAHGYAENNLTFSLLASLFTGQISSESTFLRNNMVVGETKVQLPEYDRDRAEALILTAFGGAGGQQTLTMDEAIRAVKAKYEAANLRWKQSKVEEEAKILFDAVNERGRLGGMSVLSPEGQEIITKEGAKGVFLALSKGQIDFNDASMQGMWIDKPTRKAIEDEWSEELIQEGVDLGLPQQTAEYRMRRIMYGDSTDPEAPGLKSILYSDKIPYSGTARYNQLNMTYMIGPDGKPWATPFGRASIASAFGIPVPQRPVPAGPGMHKDERGNLVDDVLGINLGVMGLERQLEEPPDPTDTSSQDKAAAKTYTPQVSKDYTPFKRFASGGGYSSYGPNFSRMPYLPEVRQSPRPDDIPFINTNTPFVRRARVNTERITSDRGRLKPWQ